MERLRRDPGSRGRGRSATSCWTGRRPPSSCARRRRSSRDVLMLEVQGVTEGPLYERMKGNLLDLDGDDHRRQRKLVQPSFTPPAADGTGRRCGACSRSSRSASRQPGAAISSPPSPSPTRRRSSPRSWARRSRTPTGWALGEPDPGSVRPGEDATMLPELERAAGEFVDYTRALIAARASEPGGRPDLRADRRRGGGRPAHRGGDASTW